MPNNKRPRKTHKPRLAAVPLTIRHNEEAERELQLTPHMELMKFREGYADEKSWHTIVCRLNIGVIAANDVGDDYSGIRKGLDAMLRIQDRYNKTQKWGISGEDYRDIGDALVQTDNLQLSMTQKQLAKAIKYVYQNAAM